MYLTITHTIFHESIYLAADFGVKAHFLSLQTTDGHGGKGSILRSMLAIVLLDIITKGLDVTVLRGRHPCLLRQCVMYLAFRKLLRSVHVYNKVKYATCGVTKSTIPVILHASVDACEGSVTLCFPFTQYAMLPR